MKSQVDQSYYKGHTNNLSDRLRRYNNKEEAYTKKLAPWDLICCCEKGSKSEAYQLEKKLKKLSVERQELFIKKYSEADLSSRFRL